MAASKEQLEALHNAVVTKLADEIERAGEDSKGLAALLNVARQMLKDNNISATAAPGSPMGKLAGEVAKFPFNPEDEDARVYQ